MTPRLDRSRAQRSFPGPCNCSVNRAIASATSRQCASQLRGKRNVRSAPSMRRIAQAHAGGLGLAGAAGVEVGAVCREQIFTAIGRAVAKRAHRQSVLRRTSRPARGSADRWCEPASPAPARRDAPRSTERSGRSAATVVFHGIGADMLRRLRRLERRIDEAEIDAFLRSGMALDFHADAVVGTLNRVPPMLTGSRAGLSR